MKLDLISSLLFTPNFQVRKARPYCSDSIGSAKRPHTHALSSQNSASDCLQLSAVTWQSHNIPKLSTSNSSYHVPGGCSLGLDSSVCLTPNVPLPCPCRVTDLEWGQDWRMGFG